MYTKFITVLALGIVVAMIYFFYPGVSLNEKTVSTKPAVEEAKNQNIDSALAASNSQEEVATLRKQQELLRAEYNKALQENVVLAAKVKELEDRLKQPAVNVTGEAKKQEVVQNEVKISTVQLLLKSIGYDPGSADGKLGRKTKEAIINFSADVGVNPNELSTLELYDVLKGYEEVHSARNDWRTVISSDTFRKWLDAQTPDTMVEYRQIMKEGKGKEIIDMLNKYEAEASARQ